MVDRFSGLFLSLKTLAKLIKISNFNINFSNHIVIISPKLKIQISSENLKFSEDGFGRWAKPTRQKTIPKYLFCYNEYVNSFVTVSPVYESCFKHKRALGKTEGPFALGDGLL